MATSDLNADGRLDLAVAGSRRGHYMHSTTVSVLPNRVYVPVLLGPRIDYPAAVRPHGIAIRDYNRDGYLDVAVANGGGVGLGPG